MVRGADGGQKKSIERWVRFKYLHPYIDCRAQRDPSTGEQWGCDWIAQFNPASAYRCERCPLPVADPGPEVRARMHLHGYLYAYPEGHPIREHRWRVLTERRSARSLSPVIEDLVAIDECVQRLVLAEMKTKRKHGEATHRGSR